MCRSQLEPALAILCACLVTLRPLFVNLNLKAHISALSSRFNRNKEIPSSKFPSSSDPGSEHHSQPQWPGVRGPQQESKKSGSTDNLHIENIDLGTRDMESQDTQCSTSV